MLIIMLKMWEKQVFILLALFCYGGLCGNSNVICNKSLIKILIPWFVYRQMYLNETDILIVLDVNFHIAGHIF